MPAIDFGRVKQIVKLGDVMALLGLTWTRQSRTFVRARCPLGCHEDKHACKFDGTTNLWYCHRCKTGGSALDLYCRVKHLTVFAAAVELCELLHRELPLLAAVPARKDRAVKDPETVLDTDA